MKFLMPGALGVLSKNAPINSGSRVPNADARDDSHMGKLVEILSHVSEGSGTIIPA